MTLVFITKNSYNSKVQKSKQDLYPIMWKIFRSKIDSAQTNRWPKEKEGKGEKIKEEKVKEKEKTKGKVEETENIKEEKEKAKE